MLIEQKLVGKEIPRDNPPKFAGFDLAKSCVYHMGEKGHDVDNCYTLKVKIQNLLDKKFLSFKMPHQMFNKIHFPIIPKLLM